MSKKFDIIGLGYALRGVKFAFLEEKNLKIELIAGALVMILGLVLGVGFAELAILALSAGFVICAELMNSAIELMVDYIGAEWNEAAGRIKDVSASIVLVSAAISVVVGLCVFLPRIIQLITGA